MTFAPARRGREEGQASVELALLLPLVVLLLLAILQVGLLARDAVLVSHASREGARAAAIDPRPGAAAAAARDSGGLDPERMEVTVTGSRAPGGRVRVSVTYRAPTEVPLIGSLLGEPAMRSSTTMRVESPVPAPADPARKPRRGRTGEPNDPFPSRAVLVAGSTARTAKRDGEWTGGCGARSLHFGGRPVSRRITPATQAAGPAGPSGGSSAHAQANGCHPCQRSGAGAPHHPLGGGRRA